MTSNLDTYSGYRDTGLPWLDQVPDHWTNAKLRTLLHPVNSRGGNDLPLLSVTRGNGVIKRDITNKDENHNYIPEDLSNYRVVRKGQFAVNKMKAWQGSYGISRFDGLVSPAYFVFDLDGVNPDFFHHAIRSKAYVPFFWQASDGIRVDQWDLSTQRMKEISFLVPPLEEQNAIVRYLDHMDNLIKRYIRAKQKQIKLLNEQKQAIIDQVVTHGLELHPTLIPTGNVLLDFIPKGWQFLPLKRWVSTKITDGPHETPELIDFGVPFMSAESMVNGHLDFNHKRGYISQGTHEYFCKKCHPRKDDIFMCKSGATTGKVVIVETDQEFSVWSPLALIRVNPKKVLPQLLFFILQSTYVQQQVQTKWSFGTQQNLSMAAMERIQIALPSHEEQLELYAQITKLLTNLEIIIQKINNEVELIHDYRKRLIADVIVGKLDVYKAAAHLPVELSVLDQDEEVQLGDGDFEDVESELEGGEQ